LHDEVVPKSARMTVTRRGLQVFGKRGLTFAMLLLLFRRLFYD